MRNGSLALAATGMITAVALSQVQPQTAGGNIATSLGESPTASIAGDIKFDGGTLRSAPGAEAGEDGKKNALLTSAASSSSSRPSGGLFGNTNTAGNAGQTVDAGQAAAVEAATVDGASGHGHGNDDDRNNRTGGGEISSGNGSRAGEQEPAIETPKPESTPTPTGELSSTETASDAPMASAGPDGATPEAEESPDSAAVETMQAPDDASSQRSVPETTPAPESEQTRAPAPASPAPAPTNDVDGTSNAAPTSDPAPDDEDTAPSGMSGSVGESSPGDSNVDEATTADDPASTAGTSLDPTSTLSKLLNPVTESDASDDDEQPEQDRKSFGSGD